MYTRRHVQNIFRRTYPETFFETTENKGSNEIPETFSTYSTVFSQHAEPKLNNADIVKRFQAADRSIVENNPVLMEQIKLNASVQPVIPEYVQSFLFFKKLCNELLAEIGDYSETEKILAKE